MLLPPLLLPFLLHFSIADIYCPEAVVKCPSDVHYHHRVNQTIRAVLRDIHRLKAEAREFKERHDRELHKFTLDLRVALLTDQRMLESLQLLQKRHGANFTGHPEFDEECERNGITLPSFDEEDCNEEDSEEPQILPEEPPCDEENNGTVPVNTTILATEEASNEKRTLALEGELSIEQFTEYCHELIGEVCKGCKVPEYLINSRIFGCPYGTSFYKHVRKLWCSVDNFTASVVDREGSVYEKALECRPYGSPPNTEVEKEKCAATCDKAATCKGYKEEDVLCACPPGYADFSPEKNKIPGSVCKKCTVMHDTDFVLLYDNSGSMNPKDRRIFNVFISEFIDFIFHKGGNNRIAAIPFADVAIVRVPLTNQTKELRKFLKDTARNPNTAGNTNTARAMHVANREIYTFKSPRRRVTILFTDGVPSICNQYSNVSIAPELEKGRPELDKCIKAELTAARKEMAWKHKAEIFVVYVGELTNKDAAVLKYIHKDDKHLVHDESFENLRWQVASQLQKTVC